MRTIQARCLANQRAFGLSDTNQAQREPAASRKASQSNAKLKL